MTVKEYVLSKPTMGINGWLEAIEKDGWSVYSSLILSCAERFDKIEVNHKADFINTVNL